ncbi:MAG: TrkH family potassium uptake protein [Candidatus Nezhaarchaeota archaeon]|nr:TrkH family potassium uptake protein [Candidatus Nezhaarchaeota archaeon]
MINVRSLIGGLSAVILSIGLIFALPIVVALIYAEGHALLGFLAPMVIVTCIGFITYRRVGPPTRLTIAEAMVISSIGWLLVAAFSSIPYAIVLGMCPLDAYFEAFSSITTTGMTVIPVLEGIPKSILFWRALGEWIGGAGIILFTTLLLLSREGVIAWRLYVSEAREERLAPTVKETIRDIWSIYVFYTVLCAFILMFVGLEPFDAICHALTCISSGGFSTRTENVGAFNNVMVEVVLMVFMVLAATRFSLHYRLFTGDVKGFVRDVEFKAFILILVVSSLIVSLDFAFKLNLNFHEAFRMGFFHCISVCTTTGFTITDLASFDYPPLSKAVLLMLMIIGGCLNSTAGGIKVWRLLILFKVARHEVEGLLLPPEALRRLKFNGRVLEDSEVIRVASFFFMYIFFALTATAVMMFFESDFLGCLSGVFSAMATVGPFFASPLTLSPASKIILIISMWIGRLELIPVFLLFTPKLWRGRKVISSHS